MSSFVTMDAQKILTACNLGLQKIQSKREQKRKDMIAEWLQKHPHHWWTKQKYTEKDAIESLSAGGIWSDFSIIDFLYLDADSILAETKAIAEVAINNGNNLINISRNDFIYIKPYYK